METNVKIYLDINAPCYKMSYRSDIVKWGSVNGMLDEKVRKALSVIAEPYNGGEVKCQILIDVAEYIVHISYVGIEKMGIETYKRGDPEIMRAVETLRSLIVKEPYNAKVVCVGAMENSDFVKGKIYEVKNGNLTLNGDVLKDLTSLEDMNAKLLAHFIELVE